MERSQNSFYDLCFLRTNCLAFNLAAHKRSGLQFLRTNCLASYQTRDSEGGGRIRSNTTTPKKSDTHPPRPWPPTHPYRRSDQELATPPAQVVRKNPRRHSYCDDMDGSAAMEGWGALAAEGLYFL